tara:strand:+ start:138 stop:257 length:120 start_codon:yes stop_codon:yes gene_type:complete
LVADRLNTSLEFIKAMTLEEFNTWIAYLSLENKRIKENG